MEDNRPSLLPVNVSFATAVDVEGSSLTVCCNLE